MSVKAGVEALAAHIAGDIKDLRSSVAAVEATQGPAGPPGPIGNTVSTTLAAGAYTVNPAYGTDYTFTLTGNITLSASGMLNGTHMTVDIVQDGVGGRTVTLPTSWIGYDSVVVSTTPNTITSLVLRKSVSGIMVKAVLTAPMPSEFWSPNALSNRIAWFASNAIQGEDGDVVTAWDNPWGTDGTIAGGPLLKVLNGQKYVLFDGVDDHVDSDYGSNVAQPFVYAFVAKVPGNGPVISGTAGQTTAADILTSGGNWEMEPTSGLTRPNSANWSTVVAQYKTGGNDSLRVNGSEKNDVNVNTLKVARWLRIGADDTGLHNAMSMAEFVSVSGIIDGTTLANIETYLNAIRDNLNGV